MPLNQEEDETNFYRIFEDKLALKFKKQHAKDVDLLNRIEDKYFDLSIDPYAESIKSFKSRRCPKCKKTRIGDYRMIYYIYQSEKEIQILDIGHRKNIYKKWD